MNGKTPLYLSLAVVGVFIAVMLAVQPYSANWPGRDYVRPAHRYLQAAIRNDSLAVRRLSLSPVPAFWALAAGRAHRLDPWRGPLQVWRGERRGDTTEVFVYPSDVACEESPIIFRFVGVGADARVVEASSSCPEP
jgi:hypothetical protein